MRLYRANLTSVDLFYGADRSHNMADTPVMKEVLTQFFSAYGGLLFAHVRKLFRVICHCNSMLNGHLRLAVYILPVQAKSIAVCRGRRMFE